MKKSELIKQLEAIPEDPEVVITESESGITTRIDLVEQGLLENQGNNVLFTYSFSEQRQADEPNLEDCIILWI